MQALGQGILFAGLLVSLLANSMLLCRAYRRGTLFLFICLLVPFVLCWFCLRRIKEVWRPMLLGLASELMVLVGAALIGGPDLLDQFLWF